MVKLKDIPESLYENIILSQGHVCLDLEYAFIIKSDDNTFIYKTILNMNEIKNMLKY